MTKVKIAALILTKNEEIHISRAIASIRNQVDSIYVIDSLSQDNTVNIASKEGAHVLLRPWDSYAGQINWALAELPDDINWVIRLDADEYLDPDNGDLRDEIARHCLVEPDCEGILCLRSMIFMGRKLKYGGMGEKPVLRLFRKKNAVCDDRLVDEHIHVKGPVRLGQVMIIDHGLKGMAFWIEKHRQYADLEARQYLKDRENMRQLVDAGSSNTTQFMKRRVFYKLPPFLRPILYFMFRYLGQGGFMDGYAGLCYAYRQACWYRFLVDLKIMRMSRYKRNN
jgi:glycosyltransferase involved in cell wall biosynthesis